MEWFISEVTRMNHEDLINALLEKSMKYTALERLYRFISNLLEDRMSELAEKVARRFLIVSDDPVVGIEKFKTALLEAIRSSTGVEIRESPYYPHEYWVLVNLYQVYSTKSYEEAEKVRFLLEQAAGKLKEEINKDPVCTKLQALLETVRQEMQEQYNYFMKELSKHVGYLSSN
jgi:tryptophanyl-tRNA synthetase